MLPAFDASAEEALNLPLHCYRTMNLTEYKTPKQQITEDYVDVKASTPLSLKPQTKLTARKSIIMRGRVSRGRKGKTKGQAGALRLPPELNATPVVGHVFRFQNTADITTVSITVGNLIGICGTIGTVTNTTVASVASSIKLRRIDCWPGISTGEHNPEISMATNYGTTSDRSTTKTIPLGVTVSGAFSVRPKRDSLAALWQNSSTTSSTLFTIYDLPKGSVVDVHLTFCMRNSQNGVSYTVATAVIGTMYYMYLDGPSTHLFTPVALPNTF